MNEVRYFNRELSWLDFNDRVLGEARDASVPLFERMKFLAITAGNLDEFFMVRVGSLHLQREGGGGRDPAGMTPTQQLRLIRGRVLKMVEDQYDIWNRGLQPQLLTENIRFFRSSELNPTQRAYLDGYFTDELLPVLSPQAVPPVPGAEPLFPNLVLMLCARLAPKKQGDPDDFATITVPTVLNRFAGIPDPQYRGYILIEDVIRMHADRLFPGRKVVEAVAFRIARNADMTVQEDQGDLGENMREILDARKDSACVRLEMEAGTTRVMERFLRTVSGASAQDVYHIPGPLALSAWMALTRLSGFDHLCSPHWPPQPPPGIDLSRPMLEVLSEQSLLLVHPYESFDPIVRLLAEAAEDPDVIAIKQILYRTSRNSPVVAALMRAAEKGKYVTVLVELKARFDEQRNLDWARDMEHAGVQVIYGVKKLKTHAKICMIVRREAGGLQRYMHFGTGNYNEVTANLYTDVSLLTNDADLGFDATQFFNMITGYSEPTAMRKLVAAPLALRDRLMELIEQERIRKRSGQKAFIRAKVNSLVDQPIIDALYAASQDGVDVHLNVRGACCLVPGVPGLSERIRVVSIIDRFLEHARIIHFHHGGEDLMFISSADWMSRNLDSRIELMAPVEPKRLKRRLADVLSTCLSDNQKAHELQPTGEYLRLTPQRRRQMRSQETLYQEVVDAGKEAAGLRRTHFEPHRPSSS